MTFHTFCNTCCNILYTGYLSCLACCYGCRCQNKPQFLDSEKNKRTQLWILAWKVTRTAFKGKSCSPQTEGITSDHQCGWSCCSPIGKKIYGNHLVGGFNQPLWKMNDFVSWDDYSIPNIWKVNPKPNSMVPVTTNQWWLTIINHHYPIPNHQPAMSSSHPIHPFLPPSSCPSSSGELPMGSSAAKLYIYMSMVIPGISPKKNRELLRTCQKRDIVLFYRFGG